MRTKNIFKALALAMLMPAMLLTSACSSEDDLVNNTAENTEAVANKGYALPVTVSATRGGDATRATFDGSKLNFSTGDKLFVYGSATAAGSFAGELDYVPATGKFSGTIYTQKEWTGTPDALFTAASAEGNLTATLLPNGYDANGNNSFLSINNNSTTDIAYDDRLTVSFSNAFVASETAKATGVEQLSWEQAINNYSSGFALSPGNAILNFTITGLEAGAKDVSLQIDNGIAYTVTGSVTPNASGVATFAIGVPVGANIKEGSNNLTVGTHNFTLPGSTTFAVGKIYNIARSTTGALINLAEVSANKVAQNGDILTGTLAHNVRISIADGATVILNGVSINATGEWTSGNYAGITCLGDATIILNGTNTVKGFYQSFPGIEAAAGKTLTINGTGSLTASSYGYGAGIGGGDGIACGNIEIQGGTITATGGERGAGIGGGNDADCGNITISGGTVTATGGWRAAGIGSGRKYDYGSCGDILISGGTVTATGGDDAAGIGGGRGYNSGYLSSCGTITITTGVTKVTATKGDGAPNSIGAGNLGTCGTVKFGNQTMYNGSIWTTTPTSGNTYGGFSLTISQTVYEADTWTLTPVLP